MPKNADDAVLVVCPSRQSGTELRNILDDAQIATLHSQDCQEAVARLARPGISVVICDPVLPDGSWRDILRHTLQERSSPVLIVTSQVADISLWAEVLNMGGYDVLAQPFDREEVTRVVASAAARSSSRELWRRPA